MNEWLLAVDLGTGGTHVAAIDAGLKLRASSYERIDYAAGAAPGALEFDPDALFASVLRLCARTVAEAGGASGCLGVALTGQRHGAAFLDDRNRTVVACPNIDARAPAEAAEAATAFGPRIWDLCSRWPAPFFPAVRLMWLRKREPDAFRRVSRIAMLNEWLCWRLTGRFASEPTNAVETLLYELGAARWSDELAGLFGLEGLSRNDLVPSGAAVGGLSPEAGRLIGLGGAVPVFLAPSDTQAAALGCGATEPGEAVVVNGSTTPTVRVTREFPPDPERRAWASPYVGGLGLVETNATRSGMVFRALSERCADFVESLAGAQGVALDRERLLSAVRDSAETGVEALGFWGPRVSDPSKPAFAVDALLCAKGADPYRAILGSYRENLAFAVASNIELGGRLAGTPTGSVFLTGGGSASARFCGIVAALLGTLGAGGSAKVMRTDELETTMMGAAASTGLTEAPESLKSRAAPVAPAPDAEALAGRFKAWKSSYGAVKALDDWRLS